MTFNDIYSQFLTESLTLDLAATPPRAFDTINVAQGDHVRQEYQSPYKSPIGDNPKEKEASTKNVFHFEHSLPEYSLDIDSSSFSDIFCDSGIFDPSINSPTQDLGADVFNNWMMEPPSRTRTLSERLFPMGLNILGNTAVAPTEAEKVRKNYSPS